MPIVQIWINSALANNNTYISVPAYGLFNIKVLTVSYHSTDAGAVRKVIQIQSDKLISTQSPLRFITFINNTQSEHTYDSGLAPSFERVELNGKILINMVDITNNVSPPANFTDCLITLEIAQC
jgi:hypothetical protein